MLTVYRVNFFLNEECSASANCVQKEKFGEQGALCQCQLRTLGEVWSTLSVPTVYRWNSLMNEEQYLSAIGVRKKMFSEWGALCQCQLYSVGKFW